MTETVTPLKKEPVISRQTAETEVNRLFDWYEQDVEFMTQEKRTAMDSFKLTFIEAVTKGRLEFEESVTPKGMPTFVVKQHLRCGGDFSPIVYSEVNGRAKIAMKAAKDGDHSGKMHYMMGAMSGLGSGPMGELRGVDMSLMESLSAFFSLV